ncbi:MULTISPECIES: response regulator transcription factor [unclassified Halanaerobium]|uniref:response regulator transcription factor n=1 Tax=unclassified Halanaerobium TaxID=2641197 RepID=UPI000DF20E47|nr:MULTISPECIES: response regulator [unclassified Halanaerobium]RCW49841.1 response regulator of citrate/malate metabolism [Halanaerobium sp. MA284_MarDTE_T2]RCW88485.1 response regulator of citrate/malate metabolism [Halanaerobium sp. DL-01]
MKKILAVDDEKDILFTLEAVAEAAGFNITTTLLGTEALKYAKNEEFDLLMIDYHMPDINGLKLVKEIRKINNSIPILVLTVDESLDLAEKFLNAGADDFANKPIRTADLISRINLHLNYNDSKYHFPYNINSLDIPKGMSLKTLKIIYNYLNKIQSPKTIQEISNETNLAYQTVHRYLNFLNEKNIAIVKLDYGKVGRPIHKYKLK